MKLNRRHSSRAGSPWPLAALPALLCAALAGPAGAAESRWNQMDYGPFLSSSVSMHPPRDVEGVKGVTVKGVTVKVGGGYGPATADAAVCFDTNLLRCAGGWAGGWLTLLGTPFDGTHRPPEKSRPAPKGAMVFETKTTTPGWAKAGSFADPRPEPYLPLPAGWAKYKGLYVHGDRVVFSYTVGDCAVLECPGYDAKDGRGAFTRTFDLGASSEPLALLVCEGEGAGGVGPAGGEEFSKPSGDAAGTVAVLGKVAAGVVGAPAGATFDVAEGRVVLKLPALKEGARFKLVIGVGAENGKREFPYQADAGVADVRAMTHGGPGRFPRAVVTRGQLGKAGGAYEVDTLTAPDDNPWHSWMRFGGFDFFPDGKRAALCTWSGDVWVVGGIDGDLAGLTWKRVATGLFQPLGLKIVGQTIYALGRDQITRLHDLDGDGEADFYENFNNDVSVTPNFHEFVFDLQTDSRGDFYFTKGAPLLGTDYFDPVGAHNGCVLKVSKDGGTLETYATGLRAPNGSAVGPHDEVTCSDNEGIWTPTSRLNLVRRGGFYGCVGTSHRTPPPAEYDKPLCWIPHNGEGGHGVIDNSSGGQAWVSGGRWGPFEGHLLYLSYGKGSLFHVLIDTLGGPPAGGPGAPPQAGVVRFPLSFATGVMRARFNPGDGQLYVCGLKGWQTDGQRDGAFQRVRYTGKPWHTLAGLHVTHAGIDLTFTEPLDRESAGDAGNYAIQQWNYKWTKSYGSPEVSAGDPGKRAHDPVAVTGVKVSADGKTVSLEIPSIRPVMQMMIQINVKAADGTAVKVEEYNTINAVP